jgi:poly(3-hydroxybutyrate) depolymerase
MTMIRSALCAAGALLMLSAPRLVAQEPAGFTEEEVAALGKSWSELRRLEEEVPKDARAKDRLEKDRQKAEETLKGIIEKARAARPGVDILGFTEGWSRVFAIAAAEGKVASPAGSGRVRTEQVPFKFRGKEAVFEYAILLPSRYDGRKSWPLLVALHDRSTGERPTDGTKYLNEVWATSRDPAVKELREQFVIVAPTVGERLNAKRPEDRERIDWFDDNHFRTLRVCIGDVIRQYNIDVNRISIEGTGVGGQTALELAGSIPRLFAAVVARSARPVAVPRIANLAGIAPVLFVARADGPFAGEDGAAIRRQIEEMSASGLVTEFKLAEAVTDRARVRQALGSQGVDPIHEHTADVARFCLERTRNLFPARTRFSTVDLRRFRDGAWVGIILADVGDGQGTMAAIEAVADRGANTLALATTNVESFKVLLNDRLLDLDRPVKISLNGKDFLEKRFDRDLELLLRIGRNFSQDPGMVVTAELTVTVPREEESVEGAGQGDGK